jgi:hypothetical protein
MGHLLQEQLFREAKLLTCAGALGGLKLQHDER